MCNTWVALTLHLGPALQHWFTSPYVQMLRYHPAQQEVEVTNLNLFAKPQTVRFRLGEAREADTIHPLASFEVHGRRYFVDADTFPDKALLAKIMPQATAAHLMEATRPGEQAQPQQPPEQPPQH